MIIFVSPSKPFTYTGKGTTRRHAIIKEYEEEINDLYIRFSSPSQVEITPPPTWNEVETTTFVRSVVRKAVGGDIKDGLDIFQFGGDRFVDLFACLKHVRLCFF